MEDNGNAIESNESSGSRSNKGPRPEDNRQQTWEKLTTEYLHDLLHQLDEIRDMSEVKDYAMINRRSHRAKGTSATYRLNTISKNFAQLEILADSQNPDAISKAINEIMQLVELELNRASSQSASTGNSERNTNG
jgi:HPt (histidine-containing phosphotransfer) domain-containing protein